MRRIQSSKPTCVQVVPTHVVFTINTTLRAQEAPVVITSGRDDLLTRCCGCDGDTIDEDDVSVNSGSGTENYGVKFGGSSTTGEARRILSWQ